MINHLENIYKKYPDDDRYVYKTCQKEWIVVLEKTKNTQTNEERENVINPKYAKFRASELLVIDIFNKFDPDKTIESIISSHYLESVTYVKGNVVYPNSFDTNINNVCSNGIHYYKSIKPAFYLGLDLSVFGKLVAKRNNWYDNGQKKSRMLHINEKSISIKKWREDGSVDKTWHKI